MSLSKLSPTDSPIDDDTRTRLLNAAGLVFADKGFQQATVREICQAAEVNLASVNYHFGDKERLYVAAIKQAHQQRARQTPFPDWPLGMPAAVKLRDFIRTMLVRMLGASESPWQHRLMMREILNPTQACREMVEDYIRPTFELLLSILTELLPADVSPVRRHQLGFSVVGQCLFYRFGGQVAQMLVTEDEFTRHFTPELLADHIADVCLAALGVSPLFPIE